MLRALIRDVRCINQLFGPTDKNPKVRGRMKAQVVKLATIGEYTCMDLSFVFWSEESTPKFVKVFLNHFV